MQDRGRTGGLLVVCAVAVCLVGCASLPKPEGPWGPSDRDPTLLDSEPAGRLIVEIDRTPDTSPRPRALATFMRKTAHYLDKPDGIELVVDDTLEPDAWEPEGRAIRRLALQSRSLYPPSGDVTAVHILYAPRWGRYRGYTWTRETMSKYSRRYDAPLILLLQDSIRPIAWVTGVKQEASVLIHEMGHALGLATDPGHSFEGHCTNAHCLMYDGVDARTIALYFFPTLFGGYLPLDYCSDCRDDLYPEHDGRPPGKRR